MPDKITARGGYSMLEMLLIVGIVGVILLIAVPNFLKARAEAKQRQALIEIEMLAAAIRELAWDTGEWPGGIRRNVQGNAESWDLSTGAIGLLGNDGRFANWQGPYTDAVATDPWGSPYFFDPDYRVNGQWRVVVGSFGPNRQGRNVYDSDNIYAILD